MVNVYMTRNRALIMKDSESTETAGSSAEDLIQNEETVIPEDLEDESREFYFPATFQFSSKPGRVERILIGTFHDRDELEVRMLTEEDEMPEFYTPAMVHVSTDPGRLERFLRKLFDERGRQKFQTLPEEFSAEFYMPATPDVDTTKQE